MRILSGIKPTGQLTLGNYLGALKHFKDYQNQGEVFIFIADLHALTLPIDSKELNENSRDIACYYLASGLDPEKTTIFLQSSVSEHAELSAILQNYIYEQKPLGPVIALWLAASIAHRLFKSAGGRKIPVD